MIVKCPHHPAFNKIFAENLLSARLCRGLDEEDDGDGDAAADANTHYVPGTVLSTSQMYITFISSGGAYEIFAELMNRE